MLKKLLNKINTYFISRELNSHIAKEEFKVLERMPAEIVREQHETYRLGEFTATVMGSKAELEDRIKLLKTDKDYVASLDKDRVTELTLHNLANINQQDWKKSWKSEAQLIAEYAEKYPSIFKLYKKPSNE